MNQTGHDRAPIGREATQAELDLLVIEVVQRHAASLLRIARRHSLCADDAEDAYQRGLEIFIKHAPRLDPERAPSWLRTVVKHEAMAVRSTRQRDLTSSEIDFDQIENDRGASPEERALVVYTPIRMFILSTGDRRTPSFRGQRKVSTEHLIRT